MKKLKRKKKCMNGEKKREERRSERKDNNQRGRRGCKVNDAAPGNRHRFVTGIRMDAGPQHGL
jgi:hypothetical protein